MRKFTLEVCVDSLGSAVAAVKAGAHRLEVCGNLPLYGGTTPSFGLVRTIQKTLPSVPLMVMIRPRVGDFVFSEQEFETMVEDIRIFRTLGVHGVVIGVLLPDGSVDCDRCRRLVAEALPLEVTFHRAFDCTPDHEKAYADLLNIPGITRILTSGHATPRVSEPASLQRLNALAGTVLSRQKDDRLRVIIGSGISSHTIGPILAALGNQVDEYHMSGGSWVDGMAARTQIGEKLEEFQMGAPGHEWEVWKTDVDQVLQVLQELERMQQEGMQRCEN